MKHLLILCLICISSIIYGQNKGDWMISIQLHPECGFYKNDYAYQFSEKSNKENFNLGLSTNLLYNISNRFFVEAGLSYISLKFITTAFLNQGALPSQNRSGTFELNTIKSVSYRTLSLPVNFGYYLVNQTGFKGFILTQFSVNYLLNGTYSVNQEKYDGTYKKNYLQGYSAGPGAGTDFRISKKCWTTLSLVYSLVNKIHTDKYLFSQE